MGWLLRFQSAGRLSAWVAIIVALVANMSAGAAQLLGVAPVIDGPREFVDPQERISGGPIAGALLKPSDAGNPMWIRGSLAPLYAFIPADVTTFDVHIAAIDGRYLFTSKNNMGDLAGPGWVKVPFAPREEKFLEEQGYSVEEISILVTPANDIEGASQYTVLPARWREIATDSNDDLLIQFKAGKFKAKMAGVACENLSSSDHHAFKFDHFCQIPAKASAGNLRIRTSRLGVVGESIRFSVSLPAQDASLPEQE
jgi:hypothetical protein